MSNIKGPKPIKDATQLNALLKTSIKDIISLTRYLYTHPGGIYIANSAAQKIKTFLLKSLLKDNILGIFTTGFPNYALDWIFKAGNISLDLSQSNDIYIYIYISTIEAYLKELENKANDTTFQAWSSFKIFLQNIGSINLKQLADQQPESELSILKFYGHLIDLDTWIVVPDKCNLNKIAGLLIENNFTAPEYDPISVLLNYPSEIYYDIHVVFYNEFINTLKEVSSKLSYVITQNVYAMYNPIIKREWRAGQDILFSMRPLYMSQILSYHYFQMWHEIFLKYNTQQIITHLQNSRTIDERIPWLIENNKNIQKHLLQHYRLLQDVII